MISRLEWFQRVIGLKGGRFRQTGFSGGNIIFGTIVGVISGKYIFEEPLQHYWAEKRAAELAAGGGEGGAASASPSAGKSTSDGASKSAPDTNKK